ncbi:(2Fe-2S)-binding protein [Lacihabitans sp. LS3-19]|uniref:(2Fe-2S)-binding protein n=1 Tax=Lacihabitans sp. LS3-19 TaxID=2487335 RepID=UPI0020CF2054|nr:(2Fe-2S)-binding protein [Lacihabitans sp. LS3-19]MCP9768645.1 (2Fe-2S)-binding protein [Lacihabitans sp. LS3-19]
MTRYDFLKQAGFSGASLMALLSCVRVEDTYVEALVITPETNTGATNSTTNGSSDSTTTSGTTGTTGTTTSSLSTVADQSLFITTEALNRFSAKVKLDLSTTTYAKLRTSLGAYFVINNSYVIALSKTGKYIAATVTCSHQPRNRIVFSNEEWYCTDHGARFSLNGTGLNSRANGGLTIYKTATDGNTLIIY